MKTGEQLKAILAEAVKTAGSAVKYAKAHTVAVSHVGEILRGTRPISEKIAQTLGYTRKVVYFPTAKSDPKR